ncbi:MAG TPA: endonuclease domain-containing protein [Sphingopyxis sp.]|uniref:endonuclease domain-containing protein n=1 Tax=Sphingopyxis sp. TaxID=1908224 RepID=UPI002E37A8F2|nr:endonuclease domain-containing protein [Sphingopyxis sp.]HEX2812879.1 endonuclease domain-containing protein [Sphingopyxis sp.]
MRSEPTDAERALWHLLRAKRFSGYKFKRQVPIDRYIADFVCFAHRLIIEADGSQHAESDYDAERDAYLAGQGFRVIRFWNNDILTNIEGVSAAVWTALQDETSTPSPQPLSRKGRGAFEGAHNG